MGWKCVFKMFYGCWKSQRTFLEILKNGKVNKPFMLSSPLSPLFSNSPLLFALDQPGWPFYTVHVYEWDLQFMIGLEERLNSVKTVKRKITCKKKNRQSTREDHAIPLNKDACMHPVSPNILARSLWRIHLFLGHNNWKLTIKCLNNKDKANYQSHFSLPSFQTNTVRLIWM